MALEPTEMELRLESWIVRANKAEEEVDTLRARIAELEAGLSGMQASRDNWMESAGQFYDNESYYRGLVARIGEALGRDAYIADDGSVSEDVLCAKVPELVAALLTRLSTVTEVERISWILGYVLGDQGPGEYDGMARDALTAFLRQTGEPTP